MARLFTTKKANAVAVTGMLLKVLGVKVSQGTLTDKIENHPSFPSILAVGNILTEFNVPHTILNWSKENFHLQNCLFPFIAHSKANGGTFVLVHNIENGEVFISDEKKKDQKIAENQFLKSWSGSLLYAEADTDSGEKNYQLKQIQNNLQQLKVPMLVTIILIAILTGFNLNIYNWGYYLILLLKIVGLASSILLLTYSIDANNPLVQNLCSLGKKNNCNAILKSEAAKVTSWLSWSEVGFFYFAGSFLSLLFLPSSLSLLFWLNILCLPYTLWSIHYQYIHKNWCVLCCTVQVVLWLEILTLFLGFGFFALNPQAFIIPSLYLLSLYFIAPVLIWYILKPILLKASEYRVLKNQLNKFKYNSQLFNQALTSQARYAVPDDLMPTVLGNPIAETIITMVSNPFCGPCAKAHETLEKLLDNRDDIRLKIVFATADHDNDEKTKIARHIAALNLTNNATLVEKALNDWYALREKKYDVWARDYHVEINEQVNNISKRQKQWCDLAEITVTPTILINGYKLPEPYQIADLKFLIN
ncbi:cysteine peptidase family C39 domain-containing protein [Pedobacter frigiditerrae]|uniref:cysteine peptidase family C39 domain-containing protein n=1 Tax=Pedobacter frigiditerrae TaxID=2530452 RepID=UPI00292CC19E|nr:cysteine peptidase family C39 domain-containing protein [Pedobacter frigiditerrae]